MQNFDVFGDNLSPFYPHVGGALQWPLKTREIETLAFVVLSHPEWDHSKLNGGNSKLDRLRPLQPVQNMDTQNESTLAFLRPANTN